MPDQAKNILIGIFVVAAFAIIIFVLMFLHPSVGDEKKLLLVRFANVDKISVGTRVTFAGKPVGEVIAIHELSDVDSERKGINGFVYVYELTLRVDSSVRVFNTDEVAARTSGLLGERSVAIIPYPVKPGEPLYSVDNEIIYATETASIEDTLRDLKGIGDKVALALDNFNNALDVLNENKFWNNIAVAADHFSSITTAADNPQQIQETLANLHTFSENVQKTGEHFLRVGERFYRGEGTLGRLFSDEEFYMRTTALLNKADTTMNDINHYGLLFHLDKGWQRLRARRLNLLQNLSTPQEFRNYFNDEVDQVQTSLERVAMVMEQLEGQSICGCYEYFQSPEFRKVYAELLRRLTALEEEVRLYNQDVVQPAVLETELNPCAESCQRLCK